MASVTFNAGVGGDGSTVTDDADDSTGLANGGHRDRFVPALAQLVAVAGNTVTKAGEASASATEAAASAAKLQGTSTTSRTIQTASLTFETQSGKFFDAGNYVTVVSDGSPSNSVFGVVTSYSGTTLTVNVSATAGSGTFSDWNIFVSGARGAKGLTGDFASGYLGDWSAGEYEENAIVSNNNSLFIANTTTTEEPTSGATDWDTLFLAGAVTSVNGQTGDITVATGGYEEFTTSGTWNKPSNATWVLVECWGAGGGGGSGERGATGTVRDGGSGGGGGAYAYRLLDASDLGSSETVTVGAGGAGGAPQTSDDSAQINGSVGGDSSFGSHLTSYGGGDGGNRLNPGSGGGVLSAGGVGGTPDQGHPTDTNASVAGQFGGGHEDLFSSGAAPSGFGGAAGGVSNANFSVPGDAGGSSYQGGPGGGGGGGLDDDETVSDGGDGGGISGQSGGGASGGSTSSGSNGTGRQGGGGGSGGGYDGGNGGIAAGGGGGGASTNGTNSGAGGDGGDGLVRVYVV